MEATNNGQTFTYSLPSKPTPSGGYTWAGFKAANPHLEVAGLGDKVPRSDWLKATATPAGLVPCRGQTQFNPFGAQQIAARCLPMVKQEHKSEHGTSGWATMTHLKAEIQRVWDWFERVLTQHDHAIKSIHEECQALRQDMVTGFDKERLGRTLQEICDRLDAMEAREAARAGVAPPTPTRRTLREWLGF